MTITLDKCVEVTYFKTDHPNFFQLKRTGIGGEVDWEIFVKFPHKGISAFPITDEDILADLEGYLYLSEAVVDIDPEKLLPTNLVDEIMAELNIG